MISFLLFSIAAVFGNITSDDPHPIYPESYEAAYPDPPGSETAFREYERLRIKASEALDQEAQFLAGSADPNFDANVAFDFETLDRWPKETKRLAETYRQIEPLLLAVDEHDTIGGGAVPELAHRSYTHLRRIAKRAQIEAFFLIRADKPDAASMIHGRLISINLKRLPHSRSMIEALTCVASLSISSQALSNILDAEKLSPETLQSLVLLLEPAYNLPDDLMRRILTAEFYEMQPMNEINEIVFKKETRLFLPQQTRNLIFKGLVQQADGGMIDVSNESSLYNVAGRFLAKLTITDIREFRETFDSAIAEVKSIRARIKSLR